jgi:hypothetical protein
MGTAGVCYLDMHFFGDNPDMQASFDIIAGLD